MQSQAVISINYCGIIENAMIFIFIFMFMFMFMFNNIIFYVGIESKIQCTSYNVQV